MKIIITETQKDNISKELTTHNFKPEIHGYKNYSPFKNRSHIQIDSPDIDCNDIAHTLILVGNNGITKYCKNNSGTYHFKGASKVMEFPYKESENVESFFDDDEKLKKWIIKKVKKYKLHKFFKLQES